MSTAEFNQQLFLYGKELKAFARRLTMDADDAKDLLQETMLKALQYRDRMTDTRNIRSWLYMIMKNTFINTYRKSVKTREILHNNQEQMMIDSGVFSGKNPSDSRMSVKEIKEQIDRLDDEFRIPFTRYTSGYKYKEIAEEMDLPIGTVKSRIFLARQKLMQSLKDYSMQ